MSGVWGNNIRYSIFGESHGKAIGIIIDSLPAGICLDLKFIECEMARRAPGKNELATSRREGDSFEIISGYFNNHTTGTPLCALIYNKDQHSQDYERLKYIMRPGHADYTGYIKYSGYNDYRGGGHFSGRLTAPIVFAGAVAKQILCGRGIIVGSHIYRIGDVEDSPFDLVNINPEVLEEIKSRDFPVMDVEKGVLMKNSIKEAQKDQDSLGGVVEAAVLNLPAGIGSPFFDSVESVIAHIMFSIPGLKGLEFGAGFHMASMKGSHANDEYYIEEGKVKTYTNNNGGILGGITNGMPLIFKAAFKPASSIGRRQRTVDIKSKSNTYIEIEGRHDPCIVPRAVPVVEAAAAMAVLDLLEYD